MRAMATGRVQREQLASHDHGAVLKRALVQVPGDCFIVDSRRKIESCLPKNRIFGPSTKLRSKSRKLPKVGFSDPSENRKLFTKKSDFWAVGITKLRSSLNLPYSSR